MNDWSRRTGQGGEGEAAWFLVGGGGKQKGAEGTEAAAQGAGLQGTPQGGGGAGAPWYAHITDPAFASTIADLNGGR